MMLTKSLCRCCGQPFMSIFETCCPECRSEDWEYQPLVLDLMADGIKELVRHQVNPPSPTDDSSTNLPK